MPTESSEEHPLRPRLNEIQEKFATARDELCEAPHVSKLNTGELIKIDETLAIASEAAKEAVSLRRKLRADTAIIEAQTPPPNNN